MAEGGDADSHRFPDASFSERAQDRLGSPSILAVDTGVEPVRGFPFVGFRSRYLSVRSIHHLAEDARVGLARPFCRARSASNRLPFRSANPLLAPTPALESGSCALQARTLPYVLNGDIWRRDGDSNPRGGSRPLSVFRTDAFDHARPSLRITIRSTRIQRGGGIRCRCPNPFFWLPFWRSS